jgi:hypothetical protein
MGFLNRKLPKTTVGNISKYTALWRGVYGSRRTWYFLYQLTAKANTLGTDTQASAKQSACAVLWQRLYIKSASLKRRKYSDTFVTSMKIQTLKRIHRLFQHRNTTHTAGSYVRNAMQWKKARRSNKASAQ